MDDGRMNESIPLPLSHIIIKNEIQKILKNQEIQIDIPEESEREINVYPF